MVAKKKRVAAVRRPDVRLPPLAAYEGGLEPDGDYDGLEFDGLDLSDQDGRGRGSWTARCGTVGWTGRC